jgi:hypothetical protein
MKSRILVRVSLYKKRKKSKNERKKPAKKSKDNIKSYSLEEAHKR